MTRTAKFQNNKLLQTPRGPSATHPEISKKTSKFFTQGAVDKWVLQI